MLDRHAIAIKRNDEMVFLHEHTKQMRPSESKRFWSMVRKTLEIDSKIHELSDKRNLKIKVVWAKTFGIYKQINHLFAF